MIALPHPSQTPTLARVKIVGLGSAGCNMLDRIVLDGMERVDLLAINTDTQALVGSVAPQKVQIGQTVTRGLGTGGDPEVGRAAVEEAAAELAVALADATAVFILVGLGGGTGSGALRALAEMARQTQAVVVVVATLPFGFEGKRRGAQAAEALAEVEGSVDFVICFENDRMGQLVAAKAGIQEAFAQVDELVAECVRTFTSMTRQRGLLHAGLDEVADAFAELPMRALFGYGVATGDNRVHEAVEAALKSPLLERGKHLKEAEAVIVHVAGGTDLTFSEVEILMEEVQRHLPERAQIHFGLVVDTQLHGRLSVTIIGAVNADELVTSRAKALAAVEAAEQAARLAAMPPEPEPAPVVAAAPMAEVEVEVKDVEEAEESEDEEEGDEVDGEEEEYEEDEEEEEEEEPVAPAVAVRPTVPLLRPTMPKPTRPVMRPLFAQVRRPETAPAVAPTIPPAPAGEGDQVNRGRFEKSEPTIIDGQDLDVPTFLRRTLE